MAKHITFLFSFFYFFVSINAQDKLVGVTQFGGQHDNGCIYKMELNGGNFELMHSFEPVSPYSPTDSPIQASDGKLYGITTGGGNGDHGAIYVVNTNGTDFRVVHNFDPTIGGSSLYQLLEATDGRLYGVTRFEDYQVNFGTVFSVNKDGSDFQTLHVFQNQDGDPSGRLMEGLDGRIYGVTKGAGQPGIIYSVNKDGSGFTILHVIDGEEEGDRPMGGLVQNAAGRLFGVTLVEGMNGWGTIFSLHTDGSDFSVLHHFNQAIGGLPRNGLHLSDGKLFGITSDGGDHSLGAIFNINVDGSDFAVLHHFAGGGSSGHLIEDAEGYLYGTLTYWPYISPEGYIFKIKKDGTDFTILPNVGGDCSNNLIEATDGRLYYTYGNCYDHLIGKIMSVEKDGSNPHYFYSFKKEVAGGANPVAGLIQLPDGKLCGTLINGGANGRGGVFCIDWEGDNYELIHSFENMGNNSWPTSTGGFLTFYEGKIYGITSNGGSGGKGTVFRLNKDGSDFEVIHSFTGFDGSEPLSKLTIGPDEKIYGTTGKGGQDGAGTTFRMNTDGTDFKVLWSFDGEESTMNSAGVFYGSDGVIYGSTFGAPWSSADFYRIDPDGNNFEYIYHFPTINSGTPMYAPLEGSDGKIYGVGLIASQSVYRLNKNGSGFETLHTFGDVNPGGSMIEAVNGKIYGTTLDGGNSDDGFIFRMNKDGSGYSTFYTFKGPPDSGSYGHGGVTLASEPLAVNDREKENAWKIFPNPSTGFINISRHNSFFIHQRITVKMVNMHGQTIYYGNDDLAGMVEAINQQLVKLPDGLYYITIEDKEGVHTEKIALIR